jgi:hypothetical protein
MNGACLGIASKMLTSTLRHAKKKDQLRTQLMLEYRHRGLLVTSTAPEFIQRRATWMIGDMAGYVVANYRV